MMSVLLLLLNLITFSQATETVTLHYVDRPPYALTQPNGRPEGFVATPAEKVFKAAKIPFEWAKTPINRQFMLIKANKEAHCVLGMEQTASRSEFAKFSEPLYISQPVVAIMNPKINERKSITMAEMLDKHSILVKENYTLGDDLTALVMKSPKKQLVAIESVQMVKMISLGRGDFMMISNDEVEYYIKKKIIKAKSIRLRKIADVEKNFTRRFMCNKGIDDKIIEKLNAEIKKLEVVPAAMVKLNTLH